MPRLQFYHKTIHNVRFINRKLKYISINIFLANAGPVTMPLSHSGQVRVRFVGLLCGANVQSTTTCM